ncbi:MAG: HAMP domain-containing histidine kinase, partial [Anaerolineae bacterium]|nr:HAMP domain-containing histidine kinase [Anaerolineae bacterium]
SMSHELRTPLNAIINYSKFVSNGTLGEVNAEQKEILEASTESAEHLLNLINDVLDMSKIESGALSLFLEDGIDLMPIFERVIATGNSLKADKPLDLQLDVAGELPLLHGDRQRITQILLNIMSNAVKFTETGSVRLHAQRQGDEVLLSIQDTGPGIAAADQAAVFQAFKQTKTGLRQGGGTGLGMPISKSLAEAHGGRMWLESEPGQGSTFHVALPVYAVEPMAS